MVLHFPSAPRGVIAVGASAGGIDALQRLAAALPPGLPVAVCVVLHIPATTPSLLAQIIARQTDAPVAAAEDGAALRPGHIHVAAPNRHLLVDRGRLRLDPGPKENGVRPAVDALFRSAALAYGPRAVAVVLSGTLSDGARGALRVAEGGGTVLVQDPAEALAMGMPEATLAAVHGARALPIEALAVALTELAHAMPALEEDAVVGHDEESPVERSRHRPHGPPSGFTCPECHGPLWEREEAAIVSYRCRVGHIYDEAHLVEHKESEIEAALWAAVEALEERAELMEKVGGRMLEAGRGGLATGYRTRRDDSLARAEVLRGVLLRAEPEEAA